MLNIILQRILFVDMSGNFGPCKSSIPASPLKPPREGKLENFTKKGSLFHTPSSKAICASKELSKKRGHGAGKTIGKSKKGKNIKYFDLEAEMSGTDASSDEVNQSSDTEGSILEWIDDRDQMNLSRQSQLGKSQSEMTPESHIAFYHKVDRQRQVFSQGDSTKVLRLPSFLKRTSKLATPSQTPLTNESYDSNDSFLASDDEDLEEESAEFSQTLERLEEDLLKQRGRTKSGYQCAQGFTIDSSPIANSEGNSSPVRPKKLKLKRKGRVLITDT
jgi:hypothetical protein